MNRARLGLLCVGAGEETPALRLEECNIERVSKSYRNHLNGQPTSSGVCVPTEDFDADDRLRFEV